MLNIKYNQELIEKKSDLDYTAGLREHSRAAVEGTT